MPENMETSSAAVKRYTAEERAAWDSCMAEALGSLILLEEERGAEHYDAPRVAANYADGALAERRKRFPPVAPSSVAPLALRPLYLNRVPG